MREKIYRIYLDFLEIAETKRDWNIFNDIPWEKLRGAKVDDATAQSVEIYCTEEMYVPDYSAEGLRMLRAIFGMAWFQTRWAFEESRHSLVFREYLTRAGFRSEAQLAELEASVSSRAWTLPFDTCRQMACYGALQEAATYLAYKAQKDRARAAGDEVLSAIFHHVGSDEAAHAAFYRAIVKLDLEEDRSGTIADLVRVLANFKMPGEGLIPDYRERLQCSGGGLSARAFLEKAVLPSLAMLRISRAELNLERKRQTAGLAAVTAAAAPAIPGDRAMAARP